LKITKKPKTQASTRIKSCTIQLLIIFKLQNNTNKSVDFLHNCTYKRHLFGSINKIAIIVMASPKGVAIQYLAENK